MPLDDKELFSLQAIGESFGLGFQNICCALKEIALRNPDVAGYFRHLNLNVRKSVENTGRHK